MFLSFHYRLPHEQDPGGLRYEKKALRMKMEPQPLLQVLRREALLNKR